MSVYTESWFPVCEDCDDDAVSLALEARGWVFRCAVHGRVWDVPIRKVWEGWQPEVQDAAWAAAVAAIRGVRQPLWWADGYDAERWLTALDEGWKAQSHEGWEYAVPPGLTA